MIRLEDLRALTLMGSPEDNPEPDPLVGYRLDISTQPLMYDAKNTATI